MPNANAPTQVLISLQEASRILGVARTTMYTLINSGELQCLKIGTRTLFRRAEIDDFINRLPTRGSRPEGVNSRPTARSERHEALAQAK
jgi:excisionase family DNA binding protein